MTRPVGEQVRDRVALNVWMEVAKVVTQGARASVFQQAGGRNSERVRAAIRLHLLDENLIDD